MRSIHISHIPAPDLLRFESFAVGAAGDGARLLFQFCAVVRLGDRGYGLVGECEGVLGGNRGDGGGVGGDLVLRLGRGGAGTGGLEGFLGWG